MFGSTRRVASVIISLSAAERLEMAISLPMTWAPLLASPRISDRVSSLGEAKMALMSVALALGSVVCVMTRVR